jgi:hypothetical protein
MTELWRRDGGPSGNSVLTMQIRQRAQRSTTTLRLRTVAIAVAGFSVLIFGVALLVVPVPGTSIVIFPLGLAILAREFRWARRLRDWSIGGVRRTWAGMRRLFGGRPAVPAPVPGY